MTALDVIGSMCHSFKADLELTFVIFLGKPHRFGHSLLSRQTLGMSTEHHGNGTGVISSSLVMQQSEGRVIVTQLGSRSHVPHTFMQRLC